MGQTGVWEMKEETRLERNDKELETGADVVGHGNYDCSHRVPDKESFTKPILPGCVLNSAPKKAVFFPPGFSHRTVFHIRDKLIQSVIPGILSLVL